MRLTILGHFKLLLVITLVTALIVGFLKGMENTITSVVLTFIGYMIAEGIEAMIAHLILINAKLDRTIIEIKKVPNETNRLSRG